MSIANRKRSAFVCCLKFANTLGSEARPFKERVPRRRILLASQPNDYFRPLGYSLHMSWHASSFFFPHFPGIAWPRDGILSHIFAGALVLPVAFAAAQSSSARDNAEILGAWEGESKCTLPDSPCHDEHVIYEIAADKNVSSGLKMDGYKVVNGERVFMGTLRCEFEARKKTLSCTSRGKDFDDWEYTLSGGTLEGTLTINGKTRYRKIVAKKVASR